MTHDSAFPFLTVLVLLPAIAAAVVFVVPRSLGVVAQRWIVDVIGVGAALATLALAVTMAVRYQAAGGGFRLESQHIWAPNLGISWHLGVDGISLFLVLMASVLFPLVLLSGRRGGDRRAEVAWLLLLEAGCLGSFVALDLILFFLFFELTLVPVYFLIAGWGYERRGYAAIKFFVYTFLGSAFLLVGIVAVAFIHQHQTGTLTFDLTALESTHLGSASQILIFLAFTAAFAVKAPIWPFHTWSPDAYAQAPTGGSVILAAVMAKMGTYGIIRFDLTLF
ncbi:MAG: complex I subunit 4 family protein, partial [Acidimicrobiales bacterium]